MAAQTLLTTVAPPVQGELLAALGVFGEPFLETERFIRLVTKERLMATGLISYLFKEQTEEFAQKEAEFTQKEAEFTQKEAELTQEKAELAQQLAQKEAQIAQEKEAQLQAALQQVVEDAIVVRFPDAPLRLARAVRGVTVPERLLALHQAVLTAPDLATVEQLLEKG
jgi:hypothetical protein